MNLSVLFYLYFSTEIHHGFPRTIKRELGFLRREVFKLFSGLAINASTYLIWFVALFIEKKKLFTQIDLTVRFYMRL